jgi:hypothetical protein
VTAGIEVAAFGGSAAGFALLPHAAASTRRKLNQLELTHAVSGER